ncbi:MAG: hypothetical protein AAFQ41_02310 [Cyanobacteria bacterium J06623_7]
MKTKEAERDRLQDELNYHANKGTSPRRLMPKFEKLRQLNDEISLLQLKQMNGTKP